MSIRNWFVHLFDVDNWTVPLSFYPTRSNELSIFSVIAMAPFLKIFWISWFIKLVPSFVGTWVTWPKAVFSKKNNLRKKADFNFCGTFLKNRFRHLKLYSNLPSWLARSRCHMGIFWKTERLKFTFLRQPTFQVLVPGSSAPKKT